MTHTRRGGGLVGLIPARPMRPRNTEESLPKEVLETLEQGWEAIREGLAEAIGEVVGVGRRRSVTAHCASASSAGSTLARMNSEPLVPLQFQALLSQGGGDILIMLLYLDMRRDSETYVTSIQPLASSPRSVNGTGYGMNAPRKGALRHSNRASLKAKSILSSGSASIAYKVLHSMFEE